MTRPPDDNTPPDAPHAPGTDTDPHRGEVSEVALEERADPLLEAWELVLAARQQRNEAQAECERLRRELLSFELENVQLKAECERLRRELSEAREAVGEGWFAGGATLAEAIKRKVRFLEERLPEDPVLTCARCGPTPHRWRPSPEAGPHWRCSECGEITGPEGGAR